MCSAAGDHVVPGPKDNIWLDLTNDDVKGLMAYLHDPQQGLNLTEYAKAGPWDNHITVTEAIMPNKTAALAYLDGEGPAPPKFARVVVSVGAAEEAYLEDLMVGPLPVSAETTISPFLFAYNKGSNKTPNYSADSREVNKFRAAIGKSIEDITLDILGTKHTGSSDDTSGLQAIDPLQKEDGRVIQWVQWRISSKHEFYTPNTLLPQGLYMKFDITGRDPNGWKLLAILYNNIMYEGSDPVAEFRAAWEKPDFVKLAKTIEADWAYTGPAGDVLPYDTLSPPIAIQEHKRWTVDKDSRFFQWMDFSFYLGFSRDVGVTLFDIKYKGKRILYELGLQEAIAHYAGNDPKASGTAFLDGYYGFGPYVYELVKGYDCPHTATYLDTVLYQNGNTTTNADSICAFEQDAGYPMARHTTGKYAGVTKNIVFIVRSVATIGNYDYLFDYVFGLDGTIEVKVRASGYIQSAYYAHNEDYGYKIGDHLSGSMHDHVLTFKADFDILGTKNTFEKTAIVSKKIDYPWSKEARNTMVLERSFVESEDEGKINWPTNGAGIYAIINKDEPNKYGEYPGYRIMPGQGTPAHMVIENSLSLLESAHFGDHHMYLTRHHDTEPRLAAAANNMDPGNPLVNFGKFFDGEDTVQEDIVLWFNLGMHHVPHSGDLPNTVMSTAQSSVLLTPHNYLAGDPTRQTVQQVEVIFGGLPEGKKEVKQFGKEESTCVASLELPSLWDYEGAQTVSKMPFLEYTG
ncbi:copper amine oxidase [Ascodesmis nigricans]|uniref:Amine oxidase n=1 Tax=Ascodesmis nigricans TaxID=341454 RepID=A0A4S2MN30_9PEZI|nr:copper amine oxidase [Ascodesmis nigricans]